MSDQIDNLQPPSCDDEFAAAYAFLKEAATELRIESIDVRTIARSATMEIALDNIARFKRVFREFRPFEPEMIIARCVQASNATSILLAFGESVSTAMRDWEESRNMPIMGIWMDHPSNFDSLRTYVWAQDDFRQMADKQSRLRLTTISPIGAYLDEIEPELACNPQLTPVKSLADYVKYQYRDYLGMYPIPG